MLDIYLSDSGFKSVLHSPQIFYSHITKLAQTIECLEGLYLHEYPNIKRLKGRKPTVWRYRIGDYRIIFTVGSTKNPYLIIHRIATRETVYQHLPKYFPPELNTHLEELIIDDDNHENIEEDTQFQDFDRYYKLSHSFIDEQINPEKIIDFIIEGKYRFNPCLNSEQKQLIQEIKTNESPVYQIQGTAGTGKTTLAFFIADKLIAEDIFPIIITPNKSLKKFGYNSLKSLNPEVIILDDEFQENLAHQQYNIALFSRNELIQKLANEIYPVLTASQGCKIMRESLQKRNHQINNFTNINIYGILQSFILGKNLNYPLNCKDGLTVTYQDIINFLQEIWKEKNFSIFNERDAFSYSQKALNNLSQNLQWIQLLTKNKPILLILDEVQDFYWFQLKIFLDLANNYHLPVTIIILGDENQRVIISGFSWANFRTIFADNYPRRQLFNEIQLSQNFRNTKQIASVAKYILEEAFSQQIKSNNRKLPSIGNPDKCYDEGLKPRLIKIDNNWFKNLLNCLGNDKNTEVETGGINEIVFLKRDLFNFTDEDLNEKISYLEKQEKIIIYSISEAKGQEFEAVIILFPFQISKNQLGYDDLFQWYTAITRARYYESIFITEKEWYWLQNNAENSYKLSILFDIQDKITPESFAEELRIYGQSLITIQQRRQKFINNLVNYDIWQWLETGIFPDNLKQKWQQFKLTWWQVIEEVIYRIDELIETEDFFSDFIDLEQIIASFNPENFLEILVFYYGAKYTYFKAGLNMKPIFKIQGEIIKFLQKSEHQFLISVLLSSLDMVKFADLKALILVANNLSWSAVLLFELDRSYNRGYDRDVEIEEIARQLDKKGLTYEATRIRVKFLKQSPPRKIPFADVVTQEGELVSLLCKSFLKKVSH
ncbi:PhoH family protein [Geminocystis herdmanii]|uniref:PhoH family protein n=1 Tax=Geminocystis herdmanii TaxID=669359 RepID=UPI00034D31DD|nr:PhoH family protein [Geminocystis herdmanii]